MLFLDRDEDNDSPEDMVLEMDSDSEDGDLDGELGGRNLQGLNSIATFQNSGLIQMYLI